MDPTVGPKSQSASQCFLRLAIKLSGRVKGLKKSGIPYTFITNEKRSCLGPIVTATTSVATPCSFMRTWRAVGAGGHGPLWDLANDEDSIALIESFYNHGKPVAAVCHAPAIFKNTKSEDGSPLVKGKKVTGFSNTEEQAVQLTDVVPFLVEDMLKEKGGEYSKKEDWAPYAIEDGLLITGQNPASSEQVAELLLAKLN